jgi:hypothetical protein
MMDVMVFMIGSIIVFAILYLMFVAVYHIDNKNEQKITYHQFLRISSVAPEKWELTDDVYNHLHYKTGENVHDYTDIFMKTYFDMLRLKRLYKKQKKKKYYSEYLDERAKLIKMWQKDINNYHDDYLEQIGVYLKEGKKL